MPEPMEHITPDQGLLEKRRMLDEYTSSLTSHPKPPKDAKPVAMDKVNPGAKYGDRPGEKRINVSDMMKSLPSYKDGTPSVPKTGPAILHKGEAVVPADIVLGAKQFPNPKHLVPRKDTDLVAPKGGPPLSTKNAIGKTPMDVSNPSKLDFGSEVEVPARPPRLEESRTMEMREYKKGTPYVEKTGPAVVHKGEAVVPANKNPYAMLAKGEKKTPKKEIKEIKHRRSHDGKIIHTHVHHAPEHPDETHVSNNAEEMMAHMTKHEPMMTAEPSPMEAEGAAPAGAPPAPAPAA
jgi:hypothetical protein